MTHPVLHARREVALAGRPSLARGPAVSASGTGAAHVAVVTRGAAAPLSVLGEFVFPAAINAPAAGAGRCWALRAAAGRCGPMLGPMGGR